MFFFSLALLHFLFGVWVVIDYRIGKKSLKSSLSLFFKKIYIFKDYLLLWNKQIQPYSGHDSPHFYPGPCLHLLGIILDWGFNLITNPKKLYGNWWDHNEFPWV